MLDRADCADFGCHNSIRLETKHFLNTLALTFISFSGRFVFAIIFFFCERSSSLSSVIQLFVCVYVLAIDTEEGTLCQSRDPQGWHGARTNKAVTGSGTVFVGHLSSVEAEA